MPVRRRPVILLLASLALAGGASAAWMASSSSSAPAAEPAREPAPEPAENPADLFVAPAGADAAPCTRAAPCASFDRAYQIAGPGDVVEAAGGSYPSQVIGAKAAAAPPNVVIRAARGARVVVGDAGAENDCLAFEGAQHVTVERVETSYTTVGGQRHQCGVSIGRGNAHHVVLRDVDAGMIWFGADDVTVLGGDFGPGIDENTKIEWGTGHAPRNVLIDGAVIHDARRNVDHQECLALWGGRGITIRNTHFYNCAVFHLWIDAEPGETVRDVLIEDNLFTQPGPDRPESASTIKVGDHGGLLENVVLKGNRVRVGELLVAQGYDDGGAGDIHLLGNDVADGITLGSGQDCGTDATYRPRTDVVFECRGNTRAAE